MNIHKRKGLKVILIGSYGDVLSLWKEVLVHRPQLNVVGVFADPDENQMSLPHNLPRLGSISESFQFIKEHEDVAEVYCMATALPLKESVAEYQFCEQNGIRFLTVSPFACGIHRNVNVEYAGDAVFLVPRRCPMANVVNRFLKRLFDLILSALFLFTLFPVVCLYKAIRIKQNKCGIVFSSRGYFSMNGKRCDSLSFNLKNSEESGIIDKLPLFLLVFAGKMSLVGPCLIKPEDINSYSQQLSCYRTRFNCKSGLVDWPHYLASFGHKQYIESIEDRVCADVWYTEHWTMWLDVKIIVRIIRDILFVRKFK